MCVVDEVPDDEEVRGVLHLGDDRQLVVETFSNLVAYLRVPLGRPRVRQFAQVGVRVVATVGEFVRRNHHLAELDLDVAPVRDRPRVRNRLRDVGEEILHLGGRPEVEPLSVERPVIRIVEGLVGSDVEKNLVGEAIVGREVVNVVRRHQGHVERPSKVDQLSANLQISLGAVMLNLDEEVVLTENRLELPRHGGRLVGAIRLQQARDFPAFARRQGNQSSGVFAEQLLVRTGTIVEAFGVGSTDDL